MKHIFILRILLALFASTALSVNAQTVNVVEYRNKTLDAYFITGRISDQQTLDGLSDFVRTGMSFQAVSALTAPSSLTRICRFYVNLTSPFVNSHFYGRQGVDCELILAANPAGFNYEGYDFALQTPTAAVCPLATSPVYRSLRALAAGKTSNHRYTVSTATYASAAAAGYVGEGVAFCATAVTDASGGPSATAVGTATGSAVTATIGAAGGRLSSVDGKLVLTIPPGALAANTVIGMQPISNFAHGKIGSAYRLTPDGQRFLQPVTLSFAYADTDLEGTNAAFLGAAFQTPTGFWKWLGAATANATAKTVSVSSSHFTDFSAVRGLQIRPPKKTVKPSATVALEVRACYQAYDELADLRTGLSNDCDTDQGLPGDFVVDRWAVNSVPGGGGSIGTVVGSGVGATYTAPANAPTPPTVAVSARVRVTGLSGSDLVVSNITIAEDSWTGTATGTLKSAEIGESSTASVTWILSSSVNNIAVYRPTGTVIAAFTALVGCVDIPTLDPSSHTLNAATDGMLTIDYNTTPPTYHGSGLSTWPAALTCTDTSGRRGSIPWEAQVDFFGGSSGGALGVEAAGKLTTDGLTIEGSDARAVGALGQQTFRWKFTRNQ